MNPSSPIPSLGLCRPRNSYPCLFGTHFQNSFAENAKDMQAYDLASIYVLDIYTGADILANVA